MILVPPDADLKVRNIEVCEFVPEKGNSTFSVRFSWTGPVFNITLYGYHFTYELTGYKKPAIQMKGKVVILDGKFQLLFFPKNWLEIVMADSFALLFSDDTRAVLI